MKKCISFLNSHEIKISKLAKSHHSKLIHLSPKTIRKIINKSIDLMKTHCKDEKGNSVFHNMDETEIYSFLTNETRINERKTPRIEIRKAPNGDIIQLGILFQSTKQRDALLPLFKKIKNLQCVSGGQTTIEISNIGIDKALPIGFIEAHFEEILDQMGYRPKQNLPINPHLNRSIIVTDGDDTIYEKPSSKSQTDNNLGNSKAKQAIINYLESGGIMAICSGNDLERTRFRLIEGFPIEKRHLLSRIIVIGCGGSILSTFAPNTELIEFKLYREKALIESSKNSVEKLDIVYLGDDAKPTGNDYPAFKKVGVHRAICVSSAKEKDIPEELKLNLIGHTVEGSSAFFEKVTEFAKKNPDKPLFTPENIKNLVVSSKTQVETHKAIMETHKQANSKPKRIVMISGGSGPQKMVKHLNKQFGIENIKYVMANTDDGGSTGVLIKFFPDEQMIGIGDYRNRISAITTNESIRKILEYRLPGTKKEAETEWGQLLNGTHPLLMNSSDEKKAIILKAVRKFQEKCELRKKAFDFTKASIGNLILTGLWFQYFKDANIAINELSKVADIPEGVIVPASLDGDCTLAAKLKNGKKILGQDEISHPSQGNSVNKDHTEDLEAPLDKIKIIHKSKISKAYMGADESLSDIKLVQNANSKALKAIEEGDMLVFSRGSLGTSIMPALLSNGIGEKIASHTGKKVLITNGSKDRESTGLKLTDYALMVAKSMHHNKPVDPAIITKYITHIVVPQGSPFITDREVETIKSWGIKIVYAPATNPKPGVAYYEDDKLSQLLSEIN